jgi:MFS family permease
VTDITSTRSRHLVLAICSTGLLMVGLDATIVNIALPAIHRSLGSSLAGLQWTVDAYTLVLASLLMLAGSTADRVGRKRVFQLGLIVFSLGSLLCALAPTQGVLIAARVLQAIGASMLSPVAMSIIRTVFVDPAERAARSACTRRCSAQHRARARARRHAGRRRRLAGGLPGERAGRRTGGRCHPPVRAESRAERPRRFDPVGQMLVIVGLASLTYGIIEGPDHGWASVDIVAALAVAALALAALIPYELRRREPLLEIRWFRSAPFSGATAIALCAFAALGAFLFLNTLYLQDVRGLSPLRAGLCMLPMAAMVLVFAPLSGRLVGSRGPRSPLLAAGVALIAAVAMLTQLQATSSIAYVLIAYTVFGVGFGLVNPPITNTAVSGMPASQAGVAAAVASTSRQVGLTLGVALAGAIAGGSAVLDGGGSAGFTTAARPAWWVILGAVAAVLVLAVVSTTRWAEATARRTAEAYA